MERASRVVWAKRVERWKDSGLTAKEFAAEIAVSPNSLSYWRLKLRRGESSAANDRTPRKKRASVEPTASSFLELLPAPETTHSIAALELLLSTGVVVRVPPNFDEFSLKRLIAALGGADAASFDTHLRLHRAGEHAPQFRWAHQVHTRGA